MMKAALRASLAVFVIAVVARPSGAQFYNPKDNCFAVVQFDFAFAGLNESYNDPAQLADFAVKARAAIVRKGVVLEALEKQLAALSTYADRERELRSWRSWIDCISWLGDVLGRIETRLRDLGTNYLSVPGEREAVRREKFFGDLRAELTRGQDKVKALLAKYPPRS